MTSPHPTPQGETISAHDRGEDLPIRMREPLEVEAVADGVAKARDAFPRYTISVPTGGGAVMAIVDPMADPHIEWMMRYAGDLNDSKAGRFSAASLIDSYDYLLSSHINMTEATRRLRLMRAARREAIVRAQVAAATARDKGARP